MGLDEDVVNVADGDLAFAVAAGFDEAAVAEDAGEAQVAHGAAGDEFEGGVVEGVGAEAHGDEFGGDPFAQVLVGER